MASRLYSTRLFTSLTLSGIVLFIYPLTSISASFEPINFEEAMHLALTTNPRISTSEAKINAARALITETRGNALPKLNLEINAASSNNPLNVFGYKLSQGNASFKDFGFAQFHGPGSINTMPRALDSPGYYNNFNTGIVLNVPLYAGGGNVAKVKSAEALLRAARHGNEQAKAELEYDVLQAYEGVHASSQLVHVAKESLYAAANYVKLTKELYQLSIVIKSDVLLAEANYRSAKTSLKSVIAEKHNKLDAFRILIGQPDSHLFPGEEVELPLPRDSTKDLEHQALLSNSQLLLLKSRIAASHAGIKVARAQDLPQINLQLRHDWNAKTPALSGSSNTALLSMNWELFSSGAQCGAEKYALAEYQTSRAEYENAVNTIRLSVIKAIRSIQTSEEQLKSNMENARETTEVIRLLRQRYKRGLVTFGQLLDAQGRLDTARAQQAIARYNRILAQARLLMLINELKRES